MFLSGSTCGRCSREEIAAMSLPWVSPAQNDVFGENKTCAVTTGDNECFLQHKLGSLIDSHDIVLRLNLHECHSPEHCGSKTTHALVNDRWCTVRQGRGEKIKQINESITVIYNHFMTDWDCMYNRVDAPRQFHCLSNIATYGRKVYVLEPLFIQSATAVFEELSNSHVLHDMISTGFLAIYMLTKVCKSVSAFGFCDSNGTTYHLNKFHAFEKEHEIYNKWSKSKTVHFFMFP